MNFNLLAAGIRHGRMEDIKPDKFKTIEYTERYLFPSQSTEWDIGCFGKVCHRVCSASITSSQPGSSEETRINPCIAGGSSTAEERLCSLSAVRNDCTALQSLSSMASGTSVLYRTAKIDTHINDQSQSPYINVFCF